MPGHGATWGKSATDNSKKLFRFAETFYSMFCPVFLVLCTLLLIRIVSLSVFSNTATPRGRRGSSDTFRESCGGPKSKAPGKTLTILFIFQNKRFQIFWWFLTVPMGYTIRKIFISIFKTQFIHEKFYFYFKCEPKKKKNYCAARDITKIIHVTDNFFKEWIISS